MFKRILFPVDNSRETSHAIEFVTDMATRYHSDVVLLSVLEDSSEGTGTDQARQNLKKLLHHAEEALHKAGIAAVKTEYREGKVPFVICDMADEMDVSLIVMGSRGLVGDSQKDSVSHRVIELSPCAVLVVP